MKRIDPSHWDEDTVQPIRQGRRRLHARRSKNALYLEERDVRSSLDRFADPDLQRLYEGGVLDDVVSELKSGKEATVYLVEGRDGLLAAKVYADIRVRSFKNDQRYRAGRFIGDERMECAIDRRSGFGVAARKALWVMHEYAQLWQLYRAGVPVPKPALGPEPSTYGAAGSVVLMEFLGDRDGPAPRLADLRLSPAEAGEAFAQSLEILRRFVALGKVHGDYSTYNLLWWQERVVVIDFPQVVEVHHNPDARALLARDVESLCRSFRRHGLEPDPERILGQVLGPR